MASTGKLQRDPTTGKILRRAGKSLRADQADNACCCASACFPCVNPPPSIARLTFGAAGAYAPGTLIPSTKPPPAGLGLWALNWDNVFGPDNQAQVEYVGGTIGGTYDFLRVADPSGLCVWRYSEVAALGHFTPSMQWKCHQTGTPINVLTMLLIWSQQNLFRISFNLYIASNVPPGGQFQIMDFYGAGGPRMNVSPPDRVFCGQGFNNLPTTGVRIDNTLPITLQASTFIP